MLIICLLVLIFEQGVVLLTEGPICEGIYGEKVPRTGFLERGVFQKYPTYAGGNFHRLEEVGNIVLGGLWRC